MSIKEISLQAVRILNDFFRCLLTRCCKSQTIQNAVVILEIPKCECAKECEVAKL